VTLAERGWQRLTNHQHQEDKGEAKAKAPPWDPEEEDEGGEPPTSDPDDKLGENSRKCLRQHFSLPYARGTDEQEKGVFLPTFPSPGDAVAAG